MPRRGACLVTNIEGKAPSKSKCEKMVDAGNDWMFSCPVEISRTVAAACSDELVPPN